MRGRAPPILPDYVGPIGDTEPGTPQHVYMLSELILQETDPCATESRVATSMNDKPLASGQAL